MPRNSADETAGYKDSPGRKVAFVKLFVGLCAMLAIALAWRFGSLGDSFDFATIIGWQQSLKAHPGALFWVIGAYAAGGLVLFPVTVLNVATIATFGPLLGNAYAFAGWLCSAALGFGIGRAVGRNAVQKLARSRTQHLLQSAGDHGFLTVLGLRILPVAPFTLVNMFIGASGIRFADFVLATVVGRIPGIVTLSLFGVQFETFLRRPDVESAALLALTILFVSLATAWFCKWFASQNAGRQKRGDS